MAYNGPFPQTVKEGCTGRNTLTAHGVLLGNGTNAITQTSPGTVAGQIFQSGGASADGSYSTATYPSTATGTGTILRADGTNWSATTATYPSTVAANTILACTSSNVVSTITYATGTWTPNLQINGSSTGITYSSQLGGYTQIGNIVIIWAQIALTNKGSNSGAVTISNLPVTTGANGANIILPVTRYHDMSMGGYQTVGLGLNTTSTVGIFVASGSTLVTVFFSSTWLANDSIFTISGSYIID